MATRAQTAKATAAKKGLAKKRAKKLGRRKAVKTNRTMPKIVKTPRTKRDVAAVLAHEAQASSPEARAERMTAKALRVRGKVKG